MVAINQMPNDCSHTLVELDSSVRLLQAAVKIKDADFNDFLSLIPVCHRDLAQHEFLEKTRIIVKPIPPIVVRKRHRKEWEDSFTTANGAHWHALRTYLLDVLGRNDFEVDGLDRASDEVLFNLGDPKETENELPQVKGLVIGYVQSGKTANYTALAAKAFDAGFKVVIVLAGIHNALRRQTQIRLDTELGLVDSTPEHPAAVPPPGDEYKITRMTSDDLLAGDFQYMHIPSSILNNGKYLFVTKKNGSVLRRLNKWLGANVSVPTLIIDDEADQASVNTGGNNYEIFEGANGANDEGPDNKPAVINKLVRQLVKKFRNVSYVGYTATPYANVFIEPSAVDREAGEDLYPRDFIISLPKPAGYMGPEEFFGFDSLPDADDGQDLASKLIEVVSPEEIEAIDRIGESASEEIPESLAKAIRFFILGIAARRVVEGVDGPASMLVHASHLKEPQRLLAEAIERYIGHLRRDWRYDNDSCLSSWLDTWAEYCASMPDQEYAVDFNDLVNEISLALGKFSTLPVLLLNYASDDELDYSSDPNLTAIIVGGNKLSRGLTLEGLLLSYFVRNQNQPKADTLTQMGRFFGYKRHIADLTRIFTTPSLKEDFQEVALVEAALRREIHSYRLTGKSPAEFAPRVMRRAFLMPTAANKMKAVRKLGLTYSGDLVQTTSFPNTSEKAPLRRHGVEVSKLDSNLEVAEKFLNLLDSTYPAVQDEVEGDYHIRTTWTGVGVEHVLGFIDGYHAIESAQRFIPSLISKYISDIREKDKTGEELSEWIVSVVGRSFDEALGFEDFSGSRRFGRIKRALDSESMHSIRALINPLKLDEDTGDELLGLSDVTIDAARKLRDEITGLSSANALRTARGTRSASLLIYPISPNSIGNTPGKRSDKTLGEALFQEGADQKTVVGVAVIFPNSEIEIDKFWIVRDAVAGVSEDE